MNRPLTEGQDYYYDPQTGHLVLTEQYHLQRGYCCGNGCRHCPYNYDRISEPRRSALIRQQHEEKKQS